MIISVKKCGEDYAIFHNKKKCFDSCQSKKLPSLLSMKLSNIHHARIMKEKHLTPYALSNV